MDLETFITPKNLDLGQEQVTIENIETNKGYIEIQAGKLVKSYITILYIVNPQEISQLLN